jgi:ATPase subunit of ABC transporter with duplicated ATPase domains
MTDQIIYSMVRVRRIYPPNKEVIRNISLSFFYGAKIGVLGLNGAGKSTLLRIMAGVDKDYLGETVLSPGYTVGLLEQEPQLDSGKTVKEVVQEAVQPVVEALAQFDAVNARFAEPDADFDALIAEQARLQEELDQHDAWNLDNRLEVAMDAARRPTRRWPSSPAASAAVWLCAACCSPSPISFCWTSRPITWTQNPSPGWSAICSNTKGP